MAKYRKKQIIVDAIQWTGDNLEELCKMGDFKLNYTLTNSHIPGKQALGVYTLEGICWPEVGDYIIMGVRGEFYSCKKDIFFETYEEVK